MTDTESAAAGGVRRTVHFSADADAALRDMAGRHGVSLVEELRRAISSHAYLDDAAQRGAKILVQEPDGSIKELVFML